jgi:predicted DCC family thiol-disulfide oxidoreductase YuxK
VLFVLQRDRSSRFHFSPLQGRFIGTVLPQKERAALPDSVVMRTAEGRVFTRSSAVLETLERLGGVWRRLARLARIVPRPLRDFAYDLMARLRNRLFGRPPEVCPVVPANLRPRILD